MTSDAQKRATAKYDATNTRKIVLKLNTRTDADVLEWIAKQPNKQGAIKKLIRNEMRA